MCLASVCAPFSKIIKRKIQQNLYNADTLRLQFFFIYGHFLSESIFPDTWTPLPAKTFTTLGSAATAQDVALILLNCPG